jgi:hypothetical protein
VNQLDNIASSIVQLIYQIEKLPDEIMHAMEITKDMQADVRELESCGYGPDQRFQETFQEYVDKLAKIEFIIHECQSFQADIAEACHWQVDHDDKHGNMIPSYKVSGPTWDEDPAKQEEAFR